MPFSSLGLSIPLAQAANQYPTPTPVQTATIPAILAGSDVLVTAPTGSGKTTAFALPLLQRWLDSSPSARRPLHTLILVPTRELAAQVRSVIDSLARSLPEPAKILTVFGGVSLNPQMMALRGGADFLIATPGRLLDLLDKNALHLGAVKALVLDEADRMLDLGFSQELQRILGQLPPHRQNLLFSATFPVALESIAADLMAAPQRIHVQAGPIDAPSIHQRAIRVDTSKRSPLLRHLIKTEHWSRALVFVASQYGADHLATKLRQNDISADSFHGNLGQSTRQQILTDFKCGEIQVLVATDLAARGIDIEHLPIVVNYDLPRSAIDYTHRIGRTGRAGEPGTAISFVTAESHPHFCLIEKRQNLAIPREEIPGFEPIESPSLPATGGIKGRRKSKKDKLREAASRNQPEAP